MTRSRDVSAVQNNLGVAIPPAAAGKNAVINGGFDIWQRGTSISNPTASNFYTADRWGANRSGDASGLTVSRDTSAPSGFQYSGKFQRANGNTSTASPTVYYTVESTDSYRFAGQTVILSFYMRVGANFSGTTVTPSIISGTGTDQRVYSFTGSSTVVSQAITPTTSWVRYSVSGTVSASATQIGFQFSWNASGTAGADDSVYITGVQLELGSSATPFSRAGGTIQGELAACQRYYWRSTVSDTSSRWSIGSAYSTTSAQFVLPLKQTMRVKPSAVEYGGTIAVYDGVTATNITGLFLDQTSTDFSRLTINVTSGLTQFRPYELTANASGTAYIALTSEL